MILKVYSQAFKTNEIINIMFGNCARRDLTVKKLRYFVPLQPVKRHIIDETYNFRV